MMKILVVLMFVVLLFGCSSEDRQSTNNENATEIEASSEQDESLEIGEPVEVEKGLFDVTITLPASLFEPEELDDLIENAEQYGVKNFTVKEDGSVSYKMSKSDHSKMMDEIREGFIESLEDMISSGDYYSLKDINYNKDFTNIKLIVDREAFDNSFDAFAIFGVGIMAMYYQSLDGVKPDVIRVAIDLEDIGSGEIYNTVVYPDAFDDLTDFSEETKELKDLDFGKANYSISINNELWKTSTMYADSFRGEYIITLIEKQEFNSPIESSFGFEDVTARGKFIGIKYEIQNNTDDQIQPGFHFNDLIVATDGNRKWHSDYNATSEISFIMDGLSFADYLGAGFVDSTWVVFDIPVDAEIVGLVYVGLVSTQEPIIIKLP